MPRYFISTSDQAQVHEKEGLLLSGPDELAKVLRQTLATMLHDGEINKGRTILTANAHNSDGDRIMDARVTMMARKL